MKLTATELAGTWLVDTQIHCDQRGSFSRLWCSDAFEDQAKIPPMVQSSLSVNHRAGTMRGMHLALPPAKEGKLVRCIKGSVIDVAVDIRKQSPSFLKHVAVELSAEKQNAIYIPPGVAHGFLTLADDCDVMYMMSEAYRPDLGVGFNYASKSFGISWPRAVEVISDRDRDETHFDAARHALIMGAE